MQRNRRVALLAVVAGIIFLPSLLSATPEYANKTRQGCKTCHVNEYGGELSRAGLEYAGSGYVWPPEGGYRVLGPIKKSVRLVIGFIHIVSAFFWLGAILYVHILLRPAYASRGLPKGEVFLGLVSMAGVGITGALLTISRIRSVDVLFTSAWGMLLFTKVMIYAAMVGSALCVVFFVGPRLKRGLKRAQMPKSGVFDPLTLSAFDGEDGREAFIAYQGRVYDVTGLALWGGGEHMKRHHAGTDLTDVLAKAPHGEEKVAGLRVVGSYDATLKPEKSAPQKAFYFVAYMNLILVFAVLLVISFWRWGI